MLPAASVSIGSLKKDAAPGNGPLGRAAEGGRVGRHGRSTSCGRVPRRTVAVGTCPRLAQLYHSRAPTREPNATRYVLGVGEGEPGEASRLRRCRVVGFSTEGPGGVRLDNQ
jgi:hypothetical protein